MSSIPERPFTITPLDLAVLLYHVHRGTRIEGVGYEDCARTLTKLTKELTPARLKVPIGALESALWSCNLMDEVGRFESPTGESFDDFVARLTAGSSFKFDKFHNLLNKMK